MYLLARDGSDIACERREPVDHRREAIAAVTEMLMTSSTGQPTSLRMRTRGEEASRPRAKQTIPAIETPRIWYQSRSVTCRSLAGPLRSTHLSARARGISVLSAETLV